MPAHYPFRHWHLVPLQKNVSDALIGLNKLSPNDAVNDEELWERMAQAYTVSPNMLNLNNGGVSPQPKVVQDAVDRYYHLSNEAPTYYMWQILDKGREPLRRKLADLAGKSPEDHCYQPKCNRSTRHRNLGLNVPKGG